MKKINVLLLLMLSLNIFAQQYKIIYQLTWKPKLESDSTFTELGALIVNDNKSIFTGYDNFRSDSLKSSIVSEFFKGDQKGNLGFPDSKKSSRFNKTILKNRVADSITQEEKFYISTFHILSNCKMHWKMEKDTKEYFGYFCKKATLNFGGRLWTAWYTNEIPISEGPYKFYGLPGLILSIHDEKKNYNFEIKAITKEKNNLEYRNFGMPNPIILTQKKWISFYKKYRQQPSIILENLNTSTTTYVIDGKDIGRNEKNNYDEKEKKRLHENNNEIELTNDCK